MSTTVTMLVNRMGEDKTVWEAEQSYSATDDFAKWLVARGFATATFKVPANHGWDDLRFPAQGINPAGAADAPTVDTTLTGFPGTLIFAGNADRVIAGVAQMPHSWDRGIIKPHIHWSKPVGSSSAVSWVLYYRNLGFAGSAPGDLTGPIAGTLVAGNQANTNEHLITSFGEVDLGDMRESTCISWQIRRLGTTDADDGDARLLEFDIHFIAEKVGTEFEIPEA